MRSDAVRSFRWIHFVACVHTYGGLIGFRYLEHVVVCAYPGFFVVIGS